MKFLLGFVACLLLMSATAQAAPPTPAAPGVLGGYATLDVTASSASVALPSTTVPFGALTIYNNGTKDAFFVLGDDDAAATTSDTLIAAGKHLTLWMTGTHTNFAAICAGSDSTTIGLYQSSGLLDFGP